MAGLGFFWGLTSVDCSSSRAVSADRRVLGAAFLVRRSVSSSELLVFRPSSAWSASDSIDVGIFRVRHLLLHLGLSPRRWRMGFRRAWRRRVVIILIRTAMVDWL